MKEFLKFYWNDTKIIWGFIVIFILIFHVAGMIWFQMEFKDLLPIYIILAMIVLTTLTYDIKKFKTLQSKKEDEEIDLNAH